MKKANFTNEQIVAKLQEEAKRNEVFSAICYVFALRHRARQQVTVGTLRLKMAQEGYNFSKTQCQQVLRFLSSLGIGYLEFDQATKELVALKNIKLTLQSIGLAAIGNTGNLVRFNPLTEFLELPVKTAVQPAPAPPKPKVTDAFDAALTVNVEGRLMTFDISNGLSAKELIKLISDRYGKPVTLKGK